MELCKKRNIPTQEIFKYDLIPLANPLFNGDLTTKAMKNKLIKNLEKIDVPNILTEKSKPKSTGKQIKSNSKIVGIAQKYFDLCKKRNIPTQKIFKYDLIPSANPLFDGDLTTKAMKNKLIKNLEKFQ